MHVTMEQGDRMVVSACLLGERCRYDGDSRPSAAVQAIVAGWRGTVVAVCPEELGGLGTPRPAAELRGGDGADVFGGRARVVVLSNGRDVTREFVVGAERALERAGTVARAILKARSPSCGYGMTSIEGAIGEGDGVFATLLKARGVLVETDENVTSTAGEMTAVKWLCP